MKLELHEIVMTLIGPIQPLGESNGDARRLENIKVLTELVDKLLFEIQEAANAADRHEASMKVIGVHARDFLIEVMENIPYAQHEKEA